MQLLQNLKVRKWIPGTLAWADAIALGLWISLLVAVEFLGRQSSNDYVDLVVLLTVLTFTATIHATRELIPIRWLEKGVKGGLRTFRESRIKLGVDFRHVPPIPTRTPAELAGLLCLLVVINLGLLTSMRYLPGGVLDLLRSRFYLLHLVILGTLWSAMLCGGTLLATMGIAYLHDRFVMAFRGQGARPLDRERLTVSVLIATFVLAAIFLPIEVPLIFAGFSLVFLSALYATLQSGPNIVWRRKNRGRIHRVDDRFFEWSIWMLVLLTATMLTLVACGEFIWSEYWQIPFLTTHPLTTFLGKTLAWLMIPGLTPAILHSIQHARISRRFSPQQVAASVEEKRLENPRQWEIDQRRHLVKCVRTLFKRKARLRRRGGTGVWIGPQHWYIRGMTRDVAEDDPEVTILERIIGPPYHRLFTRESRLHFWEVCRALEIDLLFVEDGVTAQQFVRVLRMMFEIYDIHGGEQQAKEMHFTGLPGIRVMLHHFDLTDPEDYQQTRYPEPSYDEIARARILHVFKDRGDEEPQDDVPNESEDLLLNV